MSTLGFVGTVLVLIYTICVAGVYTMLLVLAIRYLARQRRRTRAGIQLVGQMGDAMPPITIILPMYNEAVICVSSIRSALSVVYPSLQVLVVDDGSTDETLAAIDEAFDLDPRSAHELSPVRHNEVQSAWRSRSAPNLRVLSKTNGGKADAMNAGIAYCRTPLFCVVDADGILDRECLKHAVIPFLSDRRTAAVAGRIRILNEAQIGRGRVLAPSVPRAWLPRFQVLEYIRAFLVGRLGWAQLDALMIVSGAFGLFKRDLIVAMGGFDHTTIGEDGEMTFRIHRFASETGMDWRVSYVPEAVAWTEAPFDVPTLRNQRDRWYRGLMDILWTHKAMLGRRRYGRAGLLGYTYMFLVELVAPMVEFLGYVFLVVATMLGWIDWNFALMLTLVVFLYGMTYSLTTILLELLTVRGYPRLRDYARLVSVALVENLGYRQMTMLFGLRGIVSLLRGRTGWGVMERKGFSSPAS